MKKFILFLALLVPVTAFAQPVMIFEELSYDFGIVEEGPKLEHAFEFKNEGTAELVIEKLEAS